MTRAVAGASYAFLRGGCVRERIVAGSTHPYVDARSSRTRALVADARDDVSEASDAPAAVEGTARVRYDRATLLALGAREASLGVPEGASEAERRTYPWRSVANAEAVSATDADAGGGGEVVADAGAGEVDSDAWERETASTLGWRAEEFVRAASALHALEAREKRQLLSVGRAMRATFRDGAVRAFVRRTLRERFGGPLSARADRSEVAREPVTGILYGTSRLVGGMREINVAFVQPWDGELANVVSWLASQSTASETSLVSPVGWVRANANLGVSLPRDAISAYESAASPSSDGAARFFMSLDVFTSAGGPLVMECFDLGLNERVEFILGGEDAASRDDSPGLLEPEN